MKLFVLFLTLLKALQMVHMIEQERAEPMTIGLWIFYGCVIVGALALGIWLLKLVD